MIIDCSTNFNYLAEDTLFQQFSQLVENLCRTLPPGTEGVQAINAQIKKLKARKEEWPAKIMDTWRDRQIPLFSQQAIHKLITANFAWIDEVNEIRKKQKETIRSDINRQKKILDDIQQHRRSQEDSYQINLLTTQAEMSWYQPNDVQFAHMN